MTLHRGNRASGIVLLACALLCLSGAVEVALAQFFWPFEQREERRPPPRKRPPRGEQPPRAGQPSKRDDDLPPVATPKPEEQTVQRPAQPDDRPYDPKLLRLSEILGAVHYLRELCGADEGQVWRQQMQQILKYEGSTAIRRAKLVKSFNDGYRGYRRTYRACTQSATVAINRFVDEGTQLAQTLVASPQ